jgi:cobalt/nickel transport system permease protein
MHIPDGFLSTPVWAALDVVSAPAVGYMAKRAGEGMSEGRAPLLGVLGAFVFAAQMVNFPVAPGTSAHLVGGALLTFTAGPAAAALIMTAVLVIQALVFQDGGILALGANIFNLATAGVLVAYVPFWLFGRGPLRTAAMFGGAFLSVIVSGCLALGEIVLSGIHLPKPAITAALVFFLVAAAVEGVLTVAIIRGIERINPTWIGKPAESSSAARALAVAAIVIGCAAFLVASSSPDSLETVAESAGIAGRATSVVSSPMPDYQLVAFSSEAAGKIGAAIAGLFIVYLVCLTAGRLIAGRKT